MLIALTNDLFMLRVPPVKLLENPVNRGLPTQFAKTYKTEVKNFFQDYHPSEEDALKIIEIFTNPQAYETLRLLRTSIVTIHEFEKLRAKGGHSQKGPKYSKSPSKILKRSIRGMLPDHRKGTGRDAFKKIRCYDDIPPEFKEEKMLKITAPKKLKYIELKELSKRI